MIWIEDDQMASGRIWIDPLQCIGCKKCVSKGPNGSFLDGCPWDAIDMVALDQYQAKYGELPY